MKLRNKKIVITLTALIFAGLVIPHFAHAGFMDQALSDVVSWSVKFFLYIGNFIGSILFSFAGSLVEFMLKLNLSVIATDPVTGKMINSLVDIGWRITRDIANLGFVLTMIVIAFATIVGSESYGYKKLLPKLIAAAILVNFSLVIAGVFIDFSHVLTNFFMSKVSNTSYSGITEKLASAFAPQRFLLGDGNNPLPPNPADEAGIGTKLSTAVIVSIAEMGFTIMFTLSAAIVLLTLAALLLVRFVWLSFLLILAPITWLFWAVPGQSSKFSSWWSKFIEQVFFAPAITFFIYLALASVEVLGKQYESSQFFKAGALQAILTSGSQMIVLQGILVGGLIAAQKMGVHGAEMGIDRLKGVGNVAKNYASTRATQFGQTIAKSRAGQAISRGARLAGGKLKMVGEYKPAPTTRAGKVAAFAAGVVSAPFRAPIQGITTIAGQGLQSIIGGAPTKPDSLGSMAWAALKGGEKGVDKQLEAAKKLKADVKAERPVQEAEAEYEKKLAQREEYTKDGIDVTELNKDILQLESEMKKKTELPEDEGGLVEKIKALQEKRDALLAKALDTSFFDEQLERANVSLTKVQSINMKKSPARAAWEEKLTSLSNSRDTDIRRGTYVPGTLGGTPPTIDTDIEAAKTQTKLWQKIEGQKPKTKAQWQERMTDLATAEAEATRQGFDPAELTRIQDLLADATNEYNNIP